jgi:hypothetical protein
VSLADAVLPLSCLYPCLPHTYRED